MTTKQRVLVFPIIQSFAYKKKTDHWTITANNLLDIMTGGVTKPLQF
jgi:hypothetical protein